MTTEELFGKFADLLDKSEERIDRTNDMICKLVNTLEHNHSVLEKITSEYSKHLDDLSECRNALVKQNADLLRIHEQDINQLREARLEVKAEHDRMFALLDKIYTTSKGININNNFDD